MGEQIIFGKVRFAFVALFEPKEGPNGEKAKYSVKCIVPKDLDKSDLKKLAASAAKKKWGDNIPKNIKNPVRDGDEVSWEGFAGSDFFTASLNPDFGRPGLIDRKTRKPLMDVNDLYPGSWGFVKISAYAYDTAGNKGVAFNIHHAMKDGDDERLDGGEDAETAFADFKPSTSDADNASNVEEDDIFG